MREPKLKNKSFFFQDVWAAEMQDDGGEDGGETRADISSTTSDDVDILEAQDPETVAGSGTHLDGVVTKVR
jgi:hypothetical protein